MLLGQLSLRRFPTLRAVVIMGGPVLLRGLDGPGPRSVCRAHPADSTTKTNIQGPGCGGPGPLETLILLIST
jgi:hypothetical protein